jgi:hypothetical protein
VRKSTKATPKDTIEPIDDISTISTAELDSEVDPVPSFNGISKTLVAAIAILTVTIGIAVYAGSILWSLSDRSVNSEQPTTTAETDR